MPVSRGQKYQRYMLVYLFPKQPRPNPPGGMHLNFPPLLPTMVKELELRWCQASCIQ